MTKFNLQTFIFALMVLFLVLFGKNEGESAKTPTTSGIAATSLIARTSANQTASAKIAPRIQETEDKSETFPSALGSRFVIFADPEVSKLADSAPGVAAEAVLAEILDSRVPLLEKNISKRWPIASLTKLMTAVIALEKIDSDQKIVITESAFNTEGETANFKVGEVFTIIDLIKAAIIVSSNDAAVALAEHYGYPEFIDLMRSKAFELNMNQTTFVDPAGLSVLNQSTATDLVKLVSYIVNMHPLVFSLSAEPSTAITEVKSGTTRIIKNNNLFAGRADYIGGKTGYTDDANGNLISLFSHNDKKFLTIVLGTGDRFGDSEKLYRWASSNY